MAAVQFLPRLRITPPVVKTLPEGRTLTLPSGDTVFVIDVPGPTATSPVIVLLHGLACTAYLNWFGVFETLAKTHRVVAFDQTWHGRSVSATSFSIEKCADDVVDVLDALGVQKAIIAGYSLGGFVSQQVWRQHPKRVDGLVLASTARNSKGMVAEKLFFPLLSVFLSPSAAYTSRRIAKHASGLQEAPSTDLSSMTKWAWRHLRYTSAWSYLHVISAVGRFNSSPWAQDIDVPTAVVVTEKDKAIPARRQHKLAQSIPGAKTFIHPGGHASVGLDAVEWSKVFFKAVNYVTTQSRTRESLN